VATLSTRDAERLLGFVADAGATGSERPFTPEFLDHLGDLVEADWITFCELDRVRFRVLGNVQRTGDDSDDEDGDSDDVFWEIVMAEHPVCMEHQRGRFVALKVSDFLTRAQLRRSRLYDDWFRPASVECELTIPIPSPLWHTKTFLFDRAGMRDFTERDRLMLDLLQPHLARIWQEARTRRLLESMLEELAQGTENESCGVVFLHPFGDVEFASPPARRLVRDFFDVELGSLLPPQLQAWFAGGPSSLVLRQGPRKLTVERSGHRLLLTETRPKVELTKREQEVLSWVARGKTNAEIARLLWLSPGTVRKHLENVYAKLGVSTRTAAVARFLGLLEAEAS
jgi:DNA-binding CsgD family transcriptional regulator